MSEESDDSSENKEEPKDNVYQQRLTSLLCIMGGIISSVISNYTFGFFDIVTLIIPLIIGVVISMFYYGYFDETDKKGIAFVIGMVVMIWYISSTFIIQIV